MQKPSKPFQKKANPLPTIIQKSSKVKLVSFAPASSDLQRVNDYQPNQLDTSMFRFETYLYYILLALSPEQDIVKLNEKIPQTLKYFQKMGGRSTMVIPWSIYNTVRFNRKQQFVAPSQNQRQYLLNNVLVNQKTFLQRWQRLYINFATSQESGFDHSDQAWNQLSDMGMDIKVFRALLQYKYPPDLGVFFQIKGVQQAFNNAMAQQIQYYQQNLPLQKQLQEERIYDELVRAIDQGRGVWSDRRRGVLQLDRGSILVNQEGKLRLFGPRIKKDSKELQKQRLRRPTQQQFERIMRKLQKKSQRKGTGQVRITDSL